MSDRPINVFEYEALAPQHLSSMAWDYYASGSWDEITLKRNRIAFDQVHLRPRMLVDVSQIDLSTTVLGQALPSPIGIAPMAFQCLADPEGEVATAQAAAVHGHLMVVSTLATRSLEEVAAVRSPQMPQWFQLYIHRDRELTRCLVERAYQAGYQAICVTVDAPVLGRRERDARNRFKLPAHLTLANFADDRTLDSQAQESGLFQYFLSQIDPSVTWGDLAWIRSLSPLPILLKGILRGDDARRAVDAGVAGVIVSNHGGRQLDGAVASLEALPEIAAAVGHQIEILMDGGIRRGSDVVKALALGAKAVLVGRPILWGLAVQGKLGVQHVLQLLRDELEIALALSGCARIGELDDSWIQP